MKKLFICYYYFLITTFRSENMLKKWCEKNEKNVILELYILVNVLEKNPFPVFSQKLYLPFDSQEMLLIEG